MSIVLCGYTFLGFKKGAVENMRELLAPAECLPLTTFHTTSKGDEASALKCINNGVKCLSARKYQSHGLASNSNS